MQDIAANEPLHFLKVQLVYVIYQQERNPDKWYIPGMLLSLLYSFQNFFRVLLAFGFQEHFLDDPFFIDQKSGSVQSHVFTAI